jgi:hypothetical protein
MQICYNVIVRQYVGMRKRSANMQKRNFLMALVCACLTFSVVSFSSVLSNQLASLGLEEKTIAGDGNCLFRSLADQLWVY